MPPAQAQAPAPALRGQTTGVPARSGGAVEPAASQIMSELKVSGHLMTLENGLYCIVQTPAKGAEPGSGLPGVRLSLPPGSASRPDSVSISGFRPDGWLTSGGDAALVRIANGPAQLLVTIYQSPSPQEGGAPNIQVMRLLDGAAAGDGGNPATAAGQGMGQGIGPAAAARAAVPAPPRPVVAGRAPAVMEMVAHIQERGDVGAMLGDWLGERGSRRWIEGFGLSPTQHVSPREIEYQGVLGQGWLSPWVEGGQFCGSRAMALPLLGLRVRLRGEAAGQYDVVYSATFIDGSAVGPATNGEACEADSLAAMEAFQITIRPRGDAAAAGGAATAAGKAGRTGRAKGRAEPEAAPEPEPPAGRSGRKSREPTDRTPTDRTPSGRKR